MTLIIVQVTEENVADIVTSANLPNAMGYEMELRGAMTLAENADSVVYAHFSNDSTEHFFEYAMVTNEYLSDPGQKEWIESEEGWA